VAPAPRADHHRGAWTVGLAIGLAIAAAGALSTFRLQAPPLDFSGEHFNGSVQRILREVALMTALLTLASYLLTGRAWARWVLAGGLLVLSGWTLFFSESASDTLLVALAASCIWGLGALGIALGPGVRGYVLRARERAHEHALGILVSADDAARWLEILDGWDRAGVLTRRERKRAQGLLSDWLDRNGDQLDPAATDRVRARLAAPPVEPQAVGAAS